MRLTQNRFGLSRVGFAVSASRAVEHVQHVSLPHTCGHSTQLLDMQKLHRYCGVSSILEFAANFELIFYVQYSDTCMLKIVTTNL